MSFGSFCSTRRSIGTSAGIGVSVYMSVDGYHSNGRSVSMYHSNGTSLSMLVGREVPLVMLSVSSCSIARPISTHAGMGEPVGMSVGSLDSTRSPISR